MEEFNWKAKIESFDKRRDIIIPGNSEETVLFCTKQFIQIGHEAIEQHGFFSVALSGGHTPNAIFKEISQPSYAQALDWSKVLCFWSDERSVPPDHPESNYFNAMKAGLSTLPLLPENIFRMPAEKDIEENALAYEHLIRQKIPSLQFDLIMLGMGEDGHTASLFPRTHGLHTKDRLSIANYIPQKHTWRMSLTYECIHMAKTICIYVLGANKASMVAKALLGPYDPDNLPVQKIGTPLHKALWILDTAASEQLVRAISKSDS
jgi:6-phosphogluconolactonase